MKINPVNLYNYSFCAKKNNDGSSENRAKDISVLEGEKEVITIPYWEGAYCLVGFLKVDKESSLKDIEYAGMNECYEHRHLLRDMQYNAGNLSKEAKEALHQEYRMKYFLLNDPCAKKFPNEKSYIENRIDEINQGLKEQADEINSFKPIDKPMVLYRGIKNQENYVDDDSYQGELARTMLSLKPDDEVVLDWAPICTSPNMSFARNYGDGKNLMRIKVPKGVKIGLFDDTEVRLPSKSKFKFKGKDNHFGLKIWDFEYLGSEIID